MDYKTINKDKVMITIKVQRVGTFEERETLDPDGSFKGICLMIIH